MATALQTHQTSQGPRQHSEPQEQQHQKQQPTSSPPPSPSSTSTTSPSQSVSQRRSGSPLSIDLSTLPPLTQPSPPSNTLLITQLNDTTIFHPASLATIRQHINSISPLYSFSPLKSFRRIVCSFYDTESAIRVRQHLDGAPLVGNVRTRVYFGEPTPIGEQRKYLDRPDPGRLFFISPPPSPPIGWEAKPEDPPNKDVHASDLADALVKLSGRMHHSPYADESPVDHQDTTDRGTAPRHSDKGESRSEAPLRVMGPPDDADVPSPSGAKPNPAAVAPTSARNRSRSSTIIYDPEAHGDSPALPAVMVEDTTMDFMDGDDDGGLGAEAEAAAERQPKKIIAHTSRPPLELMENA